MIINYNVSSMIANNALARNDSALSKSLERLSSGYKINHAKDNAAGLAMSRRMNAQLKGLSVAGDNANDGISIVEIADGAMSEVHDILQRMNELAVKACNGTLSDDDRSMIDEELQALKDEVERIGETTQFNGQNLLDGSFDLKGYSNKPEVSVDYYKEGMVYGEYTLDSISPVYDEDGYLTDASTIDTIKDPNGKEVKNYKITANYDQLFVTAEGGFELKITLNTEEMNKTSGDGVKPPIYDSIDDVKLNLTGIGSMTLQIGANEDQTLELCMPPITKKNFPGIR